MTPETWHPDEDALAALATGGSVTPRVTDHVAGCPRCAAEVEGLRATAELLREGDAGLTSPPPSVWAAIRSALDEDDRGSAHPGDLPARGPEATSSSGSPRSHPASSPRRGSFVRAVSPWWLAAAVVVGIVLGGVGRGWVGPDTGTGDEAVLAATTLETLDDGTRRGSADAVRVAGGLDLDVSTEDLEDDGGYLEVWLITEDLTRMVSLGVLRPGEASQRFAISQDLLDQGYVVVDISREEFDDQPQHSGDSVARGTLRL
ncbi:anti-sigma factor [Phycicoccus sp. BSK3Z-2]|uniref:Anti-sigma factor n=1 Tax=Phycicoccus avicenniae TaxID=2828860 RepID=A0A941HYN9_9MICO|nr:anti-sigma factor [Phycicoccus avicenniae]MBR7742055.1 anti-sigma factor [Phycicoccus avicenniae]